MEVAFKLDTETFIMILLRVKSRLESPREIYGDNGGKIVGWASELKDGLLHLDQKKTCNPVALKPQAGSGSL